MWKVHSFLVLKKLCNDYPCFNTICKSLSWPELPSASYLPNYFVNSNAIVNRKTWLQFFPCYWRLRNNVYLFNSWVFTTAHKAWNKQERCCLMSKTYVIATIKNIQVFLLNLPCLAPCIFLISSVFFFILFYQEICNSVENSSFWCTHGSNFC